MTDPDVLVVGAGPTGLTVALQAHDHGARVRVVDRRSAPWRPSRAMIVHPRTLEVLRPLGVTDALLARGDRHPSVTLHAGRRLVTARLADLDLPDTAFPHLLLVRQSDVEAVLLAAGAARGIEVEWATTLDGYRLDQGRPVAAVRRSGAATQICARYLVAADGSTSTVRSAAGIAFRGARYRVDVVLADVELSAGIGPDRAHAVAAGGGLVFLFPWGERATWRLLATVASVPSDGPAGQVGPPVAREELDRLVEESGLGPRVTEVAWSARVPLQHRVATRYRAGPVLLAGDAAHTFSPAGGQGMNTGIQDGANLGWKLALAATRRLHDDPLLASYEDERRDVARKTLALTHLLFWAEAGTGPVPTFLRGVLAPVAATAAPLVLRRRRLTAEGVRVLSQLRWTYPRGPLAVGPAPPRAALRRGITPMPQPGARLPDGDVVVDGVRRRLHELTATPGVHVLLASRALTPPPAGPLVHVHRLTSWDGPGALAVRPDGYVGYAGPPQGVAEWLDHLGLREPESAGLA